MNRLVFFTLAALTSLWLGSLAPALGQGSGSVALYNNAQRFLQNGENEKAIDAFMQILDIAKDNKDPTKLAQLDSVYYGLGAAYFNAKRYTEASEKLAELLKKFPNSRLVPEVQFFIAQCFFFQNEFQKALDAFRATEKNAKYRDDSLLFQAECLRKLNKASEAADPLGKLIERGVGSTNAAKAALQLAVLSAEQQNIPKAIELLTRLSGNLKSLPNVAAFNQAVILIGDALLKNGKGDDALVVYRLIRSKDEVVALQGKQIELLQRLIAAKKRQAQAGAPDKAGEILAEASRYEIILAEIKKVQEESKTAPDTLPAILFRLAKAYSDSGRKWEALAAYDELLLRYPDSADRESALYGMVVTYSEVKQTKQAQELAEKFIVDFPKSDRNEEVRYLKGVIALEGDDPEACVKILTDLLKEKPDTKYKEQVAYMIANARFGMGLYKEARADYETFVKTFPQSDLASEVSYRMPLSLVFDGQYEAAIKELNDFIVKNPDSSFITDAKYRLMVCYFAAAVNDKTGKLYNQIIGLSEQFEKQYPDSPQLPQVIALRGDSYAGLGDLPGQENQNDRAADEYLKGFRIARDEETQSYTLVEAIKLWQKGSQWAKIHDVLSAFVNEQPDHPSSPMAKYWIGRSLERQRKLDEAKQFYASEINKYIAQPRRDAVELMIRELTQLLGRKKRPAAAAVPAADGQAPAVAPVPAPATPQKTPEEELDSLIGGAETLKNRTATARLFLAKAQLAQGRGDLKTRDSYYEQLGEFEASELSANLLGQMAEYFIGKAEAARIAGDEQTRDTQLDRAEKFSKELLSSYPKSEFVEFGYLGQGEVAFARGNFKAAAQWFDEAITVAGANYKQKEALFGQGKALLELGQYPEAKKKFEEVASNRQWRGEITPECIFKLGEIEFRQGKYAEAIANYQRVISGYQKYVIPLAKSYLQAARSFDKLGQQKKGVAHLGEMLRNDKIPQSYRDDARKLLKEWGAD